MSENCCPPARVCAPMPGAVCVPLPVLGSGSCKSRWYPRARWKSLIKSFPLCRPKTNVSSPNVDVWGTGWILEIAPHVVRGACRTDESIIPAVGRTRPSVLNASPIHVIDAALSAYECVVPARGGTAAHRLGITEEMVFRVHSPYKCIVSALPRPTYRAGIAIYVVEWRVRPACEGIVPALEADARPVPERRHKCRLLHRLSRSGCRYREVPTIKAIIHPPVMRSPACSWPSACSVDQDNGRTCRSHARPWLFDLNLLTPDKKRVGLE